MKKSLVGLFAFMYLYVLVLSGKEHMAKMNIIWWRRTVKARVTFTLIMCSNTPCSALSVQQYSMFSSLSAAAFIMFALYNYLEDWP